MTEIKYLYDHDLYRAEHIIGADKYVLNFKYISYRRIKIIWRENGTEIVDANIPIGEFEEQVVGIGLYQPDNIDTLTQLVLDLLHATLTSKQRHMGA